MYIVWHIMPPDSSDGSAALPLGHLLKGCWMALLMLCLPCASLQAQQTMTWDDFAAFMQDWMETSEMYEEENENQTTWKEQMEDLYLLHLHPLDVNTSGRDELMTLPLLSERQASDIHSYVVRHRGMHSLQELMLIPSLSAYERQVLRLFLKVGEVQRTAPRKQKLRDMLKEHRHEITSRIDMPLYHRKGFIRQYAASSQSQGNYYVGSRLYSKTRYDFSATRHIRLNLHAERDAGERGIDSHGGAFMLHDIGCLATLVVGDYKASFGEGLVMNQTFTMGRSTPLAKVSQGLRMNGGTNETGFLRGAGLSLKWGKVTTTLFASRTLHDATLNEDGTVKTIVTTGYHRTPTECSKQKLLCIQTAGGNVTWKHGAWHLGATGYFQHTSRPLEPGTQLYRAIYPRGQHFGVMGLHYGYGGYRWWLKGETAFSTEQQGVATLHTLSVRLSSDYRLTASQRYYSRRYYSALASALSSQGKVQNETGASLRLDASPFPGLQMLALADVFYHPWPRFGISHSSRGMEGVLQLQYTLNRKNSLSFRYSLLDKDYAAGRTMHHRVKMVWKNTPTRQTSWNTTALLHSLPGSTGMAVATSFRGKELFQQPLLATATALYFHTHDYQSRISLYEPNVAGTMYIPTLFGHGIRFSGTMGYELWSKRIRLELKYAVTRYFDRKTQSSGLQTIFSPVKNDISLQLRFRI